MESEESIKLELTKNRENVKDFENRIKEVQIAIKDNADEVNLNNNRLLSIIKELLTKCNTLSLELALAKSEKNDPTNSFCEMAVKYMNSSRRKSQNKREGVRIFLNELMDCLGISERIPQYIKDAINTFDDEEKTPNKIAYNNIQYIAENNGPINIKEQNNYEDLTTERNKLLDKTFNLSNF